MGSTIMDSIKGTSRSAVQNQLGTNVDTLINTADNSKNALLKSRAFLPKIYSFYMNCSHIAVGIKIETLKTP